MWSFLNNIISYINPLDDNFLLKGVLDFLVNIISYINPFSENFLGNKLVELLQDVLEFLFVPNMDEINLKLEEIKGKFAFVEDIKSIVNQISSIIENTETSNRLTISIPDNDLGIKELTIIDLEWYDKYKSYGDTIIACFIYIFFIWRIYSNLPNIINGISTYAGDGLQVYSNLTNKGGKK